MDWQPVLVSPSVNRLSDCVAGLEIGLMEVAVDGGVLMQTYMINTSPHTIGNLNSMWQQNRIIGGSQSVVHRTIAGL